MKAKFYEHECAHITCGCPVENEGDYCNPWCEQARDATDCCCNHAECRAEG